MGNNGNFDSAVHNTLRKLLSVYPDIRCYVVCAYLPLKNSLSHNHLETIYPEGLEKTPPKFAINKRNEWMINKSDYVITCVNHPFGGAAKFKELAEKRGKTVINIDLK